MTEIPKEVQAVSVKLFEREIEEIKSNANYLIRDNAIYKKISKAIYPNGYWLA